MDDWMKSERMKVLAEMTERLVALSGTLADAALAADRGLLGTPHDALARTKALTQITVTLAAAQAMALARPDTIGFFVEQLALMLATWRGAQRAVAERLEKGGGA